jgi:prevent-host-death family protein
MTNDALFLTIDGRKFQSELLELAARTAQEKGRVEITNCGGGTCVLISKDELDSLERALEILSDSAAGKAIHRTIEHFAMLAARATPGAADNA